MENKIYLYFLNKFKTRLASLSLPNTNRHLGKIYIFFGSFAMIIKTVVYFNYLSGPNLPNVFSTNTKLLESVSDLFMWCSIIFCLIPILIGLTVNFFLNFSPLLAGVIIHLLSKVKLWLLFQAILFLLNTLFTVHRIQLFVIYLIITSFVLFFFSFKKNLNSWKFDFVNIILFILSVMFLTLVLSLLMESFLGEKTGLLKAHCSDGLGGTKEMNVVVSPPQPNPDLVYCKVPSFSNRGVYAEILPISLRGTSPPGSKNHGAYASLMPPTPKDCMKRIYSEAPVVWPTGIIPGVINKCVSYKRGVLKASKNTCSCFKYLGHILKRVVSWCFPPSTRSR